ncbi:unnamed protein product [Sphagnum troendelagicum]|uniref:Uncharacterized protein n=1 Tax=Sphagnum jensenii TaxID=128206 RepID=A0ABP0VYG4_9BRYO
MGNWRRRRCATKRNTGIEMSSALGSLPDAKTQGPLGASNILQPTSVNIPSYRLQIQGPLGASNILQPNDDEYSPTKRR